MEGTCAGEIIIDGDRDEAAVRQGRSTVYVTQDNCHVPELTVRESLEFAAELGMTGRPR